MEEMAVLFIAVINNYTLFNLKFYLMLSEIFYPLKIL